MKKYSFVFAFFVLIFLSNVASASWKNVYQNVKDAYIGSIKIQDLASSALKGLNNIDKDLRVGSGAKTITLYYKGRVIDSLKKPDDENDAGKWAEITQRFIDKAIEKSAKASENDFMIFDAMAKEMPKILDDDSKFFDNVDEAKGVILRNKRTFGARVENNILVVKIVAFNKQTLNELKNAIGENINVDAIILDLRGCAGGMSSEAISVADLFLDDGIITSVQGRNKQEETYYTAKEDVVWKNKPIFIFVDENTASAAEILTAALKEQGIAKVIGSGTKGKGTMQKLIGLETGSVLAITNSMFYTPANNEINQRGVRPDICTFELSDGHDIDNLLKRKDSFCHKQNRENELLEYKIVLKLLKKDQ